MADAIHSFPQSRPVSGHLKPLDGIRGLAILMVVGSHAFQANVEAGGTLTRMVGSMLGYGFFGVDLFFVLSGFLITGILVDSVGQPGFFRNFYARRTLRIFPLYYGVLLVLFLLTPKLHLHWHGMGWLMLVYLQNLRFNEIVTFSPGATVGLNHFWSLAVEEQFYLVWPLVVFFVRSRRRLLMTAWAIAGFALVLRLVLIGTGGSLLMIHVTTVTRADSLLIGGAFALLYRSHFWGSVLKVAPWGACISAVALVLSIQVMPVEALPYSRLAAVWIDGFRYTLLAAGSAFLIAWALRPGSLCGRVFEARGLRFLGKYSYGIYVYHMLWLGYLLKVQRAWIFEHTHNKLLGVAGAGFSAILISIVVAYVSFHIYESLFLGLKNRFVSPKTPMEHSLHTDAGTPR